MTRQAKTEIQGEAWSWWKAPSTSLATHLLAGQLSVVPAWSPRLDDYLGGDVDRFTKKLELLILKQHSNHCNNPNLVFSILWVSLPIFPFFNYQKIGRLAENWWKLRSTSSLREEEEFLLSGKARLRVKSLVSLIMMFRQHMYTPSKVGQGTENVNNKLPTCNHHHPATQGGERPLWPTPGVRRRATVGDLVS